jgi:SNF2 family DNA or RNA helicase
MAKEFVPRDPQRIMIDHLLDNRRFALWAAMGLGKTVSTLTALDLQFTCGTQTKPALVLAPLRVANTTWVNESLKWNHLGNIEVQPLTGSVAARTRALQNSNASVFTMNYENLPWLEEALDGAMPFGSIISDESTRLKGFRLRQGTKRARSLGRMAWKVEDFKELTGTPSPNGLIDLWGQMWFLDKGERLGRTFKDFEHRWFRKSYNGFGMEAMPHSEAEIHDKLRDVCLSLSAEDYFDLEEPVVTRIEVELPEKARSVYADMERQMFMELQDIMGVNHEIEAFGAAARTQKCLQLANGAAYVENDNKKWVEVHDVKLQALESIVTEAAGMPVLVAYNFKSDLARLKKAFPKGRELDSNPKTEREWNEGKIPILFAHPASAGHGLNLQDGGNILVFFGHSWNLEYHQQIIERIGPTRQMQAGHNRLVYIYHILAKDTVEEDVLDRLTTKRSVQDSLILAMKKRNKL